MKSHALVLAAALGVSLAVARLAAQDVPTPPRPAPVVPLPDSPRVVSDTPVARAESAARQVGRGDSVRPRPPISPGGAFLRSLLVPGWGQARLGRDLTAALFVAFEGVAVTMVWKSTWQLEFARTREKYVESHIQEQQDWIVLLVFNHFFAGAEAFVAAHLWDFPAALEARTLPDGSTGLGVRVPLR